MDELTRLAFIYGEQDRRAMAEAWPPETTERQEATDLADQMAKYRKRRWGRTQYEAAFDHAKAVDVLEAHDTPNEKAEARRPDGAVSKGN